MKYYNLHEIAVEDLQDTPKDIAIYTDGDKFYLLNCGDMISTLAEDGKTILKNTEIEGVVEAKTDASAAKKLGVEKAEIVRRDEI